MKVANISLQVALIFCKSSTKDFLFCFKSAPLSLDVSGTLLEGDSMNENKTQKGVT